MPSSIKTLTIKDGAGTNIANGGIAVDLNGSGPYLFLHGLVDSSNNLDRMECIL